MAALNVPLHVFISYSSKNEEAVHHIRASIEKSGIPIWLDTQDLAPGTPNWEDAIRNALKNAYAIILVGSPEAKDSLYVRAELTLAINRNLTIVPVWIDGEDWIDSAPLGVVQTQYIDLRDDKIEQGTEKLIGTLKDIISKNKPNHTLVKDPYAGWYDSSERSIDKGIPTYISILLDERPSSHCEIARPREERMVKVLHNLPF